MSELDKIKLKIRALLAKTIDNGASQAEMESSLAKAYELMNRHYIAESELRDPFLGEACVIQKEPRIVTAYVVDGFVPSLCDLFSTEHYISSKYITFLGFEQDVQLCHYFYKLILTSALAESQTFKKSEHYRRTIANGYHGRTAVSSFLKGYSYRVAEKMEEMYRGRKEEMSRNGEFGLVVSRKEDKVKEGFLNLNMKLGTSALPKADILEGAFRLGQAEGDKLKLQQAIRRNEAENTKLLEGK